jgi:hypothetical protein
MERSGSCWPDIIFVISIYFKAFIWNWNLSLNALYCHGLIPGSSTNCIPPPPLSKPTLECSQTFGQWVSLMDCYSGRNVDLTTHFYMVWSLIITGKVLSVPHTSAVRGVLGHKHNRYKSPYRKIRSSYFGSSARRVWKWLSSALLGRVG